MWENKSAISVFQMIGLIVLLGMLIHSAQAQPEDRLRRIWNKKFVEARQKNATTAKASPRTNRRRELSGNNASVRVTGKRTAQDLGGELIGVTLWRLAEKPERTGRRDPRIAVRQGDGLVTRLAAERVLADTVFETSQKIRLGVEVPRIQDGYLYVIDREVYADNSMSEPTLIFPSHTTPAGGNRVTAGQIVYVPAQGDPIPYFSLQRSRSDQVSELLTIIVTKTPLEIQPNPPHTSANLAIATVAQWERQWGGWTERRELAGGLGAAWTVKEKEAGEGKRKLLQNDPLPQTVYFVKGKSDGEILIQVSLRVAR